MRSLFLLLMLASAQLVNAQQKGEAPDMLVIKRDIADKGSAFYYPTLLQRFSRADTGMTLPEKRHLYYGYSATDTYSSFGSTDFDDSIRTILKYEKLMEADYIKLLAFTDSALSKNPFDLRKLNYHAYAARKSGRDDEAALTRAKIDLIVDAILSTGDGHTAASAFWVIEVSHEYFVIGILGFEFGGSQSLVDGPCDYLTLKENKRGLAGLYFNVSIGFAQMNEMFSDTKKHRKEKQKK